MLLFFNYLDEGEFIETVFTSVLKGRFGGKFAPKSLQNYSQVPDLSTKIFCIFDVKISPN
jgi:hypothetical protein